MAAIPSKFHIGSKIINADTQTDVGTILHDGSLKTVNGASLVGSGDIVISGGATTYQAKLTSDVVLTNTTAYNTGLSIANVIPGEYAFILTGRWSRPAVIGTALSRAFRGSVHFDDATNVTMNLTSAFNSTATSSTGSTGSLNSLYVASATAGATSTFFSSSSTTTTTEHVPFSVVGRISIGGSTNKTVLFSFSMSASDSVNQMTLLSGTNMTLIKVA